MQQWWNSFLDWVASDEGFRILSATALPFLAILIAGILAALIGRSAVKRMLGHHDRELRASAVAALIGAGRKAAVWSSLSSVERDHVDTQSSEAEVRVRLLPLAGATMAADWAAHQLAEMKRNSANFSFQADQTLDEYRDRLIEWQHRPGRAKRLFKDDLEQWRYEQASSDAGTPDAGTDAGDSAVAAEREPEWITAPSPTGPARVRRDDTAQLRPWDAGTDAEPTTRPEPAVGDDEFTHPPVSATAVRQRIAPQPEDDDVR